MNEDALAPVSTVAKQTTSKTKTSKSVFESPKRPLRIARKVLVPVDGSQRSFEALRHLIDSVGTEAVEVHAVNVQRLSMQGDFALNVALQLEARARLAGAEQVLERARMVLTAKGIPFKTTVLFGDPAEAIARYATEHDFDAIVMGTRGPNTTGLPDGFVALKVLGLTNVPVTLVKAPTGRYPKPSTGSITW
jgi:nucleotide-binding universal stress UspA family protein